MLKGSDPKHLDAVVLVVNSTLLPCSLFEGLPLPSKGLRSYIMCAVISLHEETAGCFQVNSANKSNNSNLLYRGVFEIVIHDAVVAEP